MGEFLRLIVTNFWPFVATVILIGTIADAVAKIVAAWRGRHDQ